MRCVIRRRDWRRARTTVSSVRAKSERTISNLTRRFKSFSQMNAIKTGRPKPRRRPSHPQKNSGTIRQAFFRNFVWRCAPLARLSPPWFQWLGRQRRWRRSFRAGARMLTASLRNEPSPSYVKERSHVCKTASGCAFVNDAAWLENRFLFRRRARAKSLCCGLNLRRRIRRKRQRDASCTQGGAKTLAKSLQCFAWERMRRVTVG